MKLLFNLLGIAMAAALLSSAAKSAQTIIAHTWQAEVLPPEHRIVRDKETEVDLLFITTDAARDHNFYFHERSFLSDGSMVLFYSSRARGGLMGYLFATGELVRLMTPKGGLGGATAARRGNRVFAVRAREVLELSLKIEPSADPAKAPSVVVARERVICRVPEGMGVATALNENADGTLLSLGVHRAGGGVGIIVIEIRTGKVRQVCRMGGFGGHVQFSITNPYLLSFAGRPRRLMVVDIRDGRPRSIHRQAEGELVTHECWWVKDQLTFCGGYQTEESHVKVINPYTGEVRIVGAGAWLPDHAPRELARWNWWHAAGDPTGRWVAADNWHGVIALFDSKTTQMHTLTVGHRTYGGGEHPEVGWDWKGERVEFNSLMLGNTDVCVVTIPKHWQQEAGR